MKWFKKQWTKFIHRNNVNLRDKEIATLENEPWVRVISFDIDDPNNPSSGRFELDWNQLFIETLYNAGYSGRYDEDVVDMWFNDVCRGMISMDDIDDDQG